MPTEHSHHNFRSFQSWYGVDVELDEGFKVRRIEIGFALLIDFTVTAKRSTRSRRYIDTGYDSQFRYSVSYLCSIKHQDKSAKTKEIYHRSILGTEKAVDYENTSTLHFING